MGRINSSLKRTFIISNSFFAFLGVLFIIAGLNQAIINATVEGHTLQGEDLISFVAGFCIMGTLTTMFAVLGAYGACMENKGCLIAFILCMLFGKYVALRAAIPEAIGRSELADRLEEKFRQLPALDFTGVRMKNLVNNMQSELHCCGLFSYQDWMLDIPQSCDCTGLGGVMEEYEVCEVVNYKYYFETKMKPIYSRPCFPIYLQDALVKADIALAVSFSLAALALLSMILSSIMIHQLRQRKGPSVPPSVPTIFTPDAKKYQKLQSLRTEAA